MRIAYLGNFSVPYCTEVHVAESLRELGHEVVQVQEGATPAREVPDIANTCELFMWTQTYGLANQGGTREERRDMLTQISVPTVGYHLDRWWGLEREAQVYDEPFFYVDHLFTADGGHDENWVEYGINHHWLPPAVYHREAIDVLPSHDPPLDVLFVGAWREYGHPTWWPTRRELLRQLDARYGKHFHCYPKAAAVRGLELNALYASAKVVIGDSCLTGSPANYWSDRVPETMGRGGFLVHPRVEGLTERHPFLPTWELGDWDQLFALVDYYLAFPEQRENVRALQAADTRQRHTYVQRMMKVLWEVT